MVLENFVHFTERSKLDFSNTKYGPNIFVGANSTGKTSVLELIRRCMDIKLNSSLTNRCDENKTAYVFCEFENASGKYGPTVISGVIVDREHEDNVDDDEEDEEWVENVKKDKQDTVFHKVIIYFYKKKIKFCCKTYLKTPDGRIVDLRKNVRLGKDLLDLSWFSAEINKRPTDHHEVSSGIKHRFNIAFAESISNEIRKLQRENKTYNQCPKVWGELEDTFVGVLSMRGLGIFQWTKSQLIDDEFKSTNYEGTCTQAEIIAELMESEDIDKEREHKIFNFLTSGNEFHFVKKSKTEIVVKKSGKEFALLKTSVGIVEAKQFSLLMAHDKLQTICLEEPDRGMHPQMIERMKEVLHYESRNKTIIVVTHSPSLVDSTSLKNTFFFSRRENVAKVVNIYDKLENNVYLKMLVSTEFKTILFSSNVLFVEGQTDKIVLEAIFRKVKDLSKSFDENFSILSHEICSMGGKGRAKKIQRFCNALNIKFRLVLDRDAKFKTESDIKAILRSLKGEKEPKSCSISDFLENEFDEFSQYLAKEENVFIWKDGELEDFILSRSEKSPKICGILNSGVKKMSESKNPETESIKTNDKGDQNVHDEKGNMDTHKNKELTYMDMKKIVSNALLNAAPRDTLDELADEIFHFTETDRLLSFLKDK